MDLDKVEKDGLEVEQTTPPEAAEKAETKEKDVEWDKDRQRLDQERANVRRLKQEKETLLDSLSERDTKIDELSRRLTELETRKPESLDPVTADIPTLVKELNQLKEERAADRRALKELEGKAKEYEKTEQKRVQEGQRQQVIDKVCKPLDEKYGAKYRTAAISLADQWTEDGTEAKPTDALDARDLMEKAYAAVSAKEPKPQPKEKGPKPDSGAAGTSFKDLPTEGSRADVLAAMRKSLKRS